MGGAGSPLVRPPGHPLGLAEDLETALDRAAGDLAGLRGARVLLTGGTGFVGRWLLELATWAVDRTGAGPDVTVVTRDPAGFRTRSPHLAAHRSVALVHGDVREPPALPGPVDLVIAGAAASLAAGDARSPDDVHRTTVAGARFARALADEHGCRVLLLSSGAAAGATDVYGRAKLEAERLVRDGSGSGRGLVARLYAFVGPYLPLDLNFAVGNFLADALAGRPVAVAGDGTAVRSYLYAADLAWWLWALAGARGEPGGVYDVGSPEPVTIGGLAARVAALVEPPLPVTVGGRAVPSSAGDEYLPDLAAATACGLAPTRTLDAALRRTYEWHRHAPGRGWPRSTVAADTAAQGARSDQPTVLGPG